MRTVITFLIACFASLSAHAFHEGILTITLPSDQFTVTVNGRIYTLQENMVRLDHLQAGEYRVKIYSYGGNAGNLRQSREPLYSTFVVVKANYHVDMMINRFGKIYVDEQLLVAGPSKGSHRVKNFNKVFAISESDFSALLHIVSQSNLSDDKMAAIQASSVRNQFYSHQVKQLMQQFSFEADRLELAKLLYRSTADKNNFQTVYSEFRFRSTRSELEKYIRKIRYQ